MEEKINKAKNLNDTVSRLEDFLGLLDRSNVESKYDGKRNEFTKLVVSSRVWTGSDNPEYEKSIRDKDTLNEISGVIKPILISKIIAYRKELEDMFK